MDQLWLHANIKKYLYIYTEIKFQSLFILSQLSTYVYTYKVCVFICMYMCIFQRYATNCCYSCWRRRCQQEEMISCANILQEYTISICREYYRRHAAIETRSKQSNIPVFVSSFFNFICFPFFFFSYTSL